MKRGHPDRWTYVYHRRSDGGWTVTTREGSVRLGHVRRGDMVPWVAYTRGGVLCGGGNTRAEAAKILQESIGGKP